MFTLQQAQELINLSKKVQINDVLQDSISMTQAFPFQERYILVAPQEPDYTFLYEINQSKKNHFKLSLYLMDNDTKIGLSRVDFSGQHENPQLLNSNVPAFLHPYAGKFFDYSDHHIHYYVEGYKTTLDWAVPLKNDRFPIKDITSNNDVLDAFYNFNKIINLETNFIVSALLI